MANATAPITTRLFSTKSVNPSLQSFVYLVLLFLQSLSEWHEFIQTVLLNSQHSNFVEPSPKNSSLLVLPCIYLLHGLTLLLLSLQPIWFKKYKKIHLGCSLCKLDVVNGSNPPPLLSNTSNISNFTGTKSNIFEKNLQNFVRGN